MLEKLIKLTSILGTFTIVNGIIYLSIYYSNFGINIFSYLEFTEILTSFLGSIKIILIFFLIYILNLIFTVIIASFTIKETDESAVIETEKNKNISIFEKGMEYGVWLSFAAVSILILLLVIGFFKIRPWHIYFLCFVGFNALHMIFDYFKNTFLVFFEEKYYNMLMAFIVLILPFFVYTIAFAEYNSLNENEHIQVVKLYGNKNSHFAIEKDYRFIGKTNKYIFLHNFKTKTSISIALENIKCITYK